MKHPNDALRIAIGIGGMRIVDKELDMMDGYEFMKVINGCSTDNDKISKVWLIKFRIARYTAPETLYDPLRVERTPTESFERIYEHLRRLFPNTTESKLLKLIGWQPGINTPARQSLSDNEKQVKNPNCSC